MKDDGKRWGAFLWCDRNGENWVTSKRRMTERETLDLFRMGHYYVDLLDDFEFAVNGNFIWCTKSFKTKKQMLEAVEQLRRGEGEDV